MGAVEFKKSDPSSITAVDSTLIQKADSGNSLPARPEIGVRRVPIDCGDLEMRIARDGTWFYRGSPIARLPLVKLFASVLRREADGHYWLVTPAERGKIEVEDVPFLAVALTATNGEPAPYILVRDDLEARIARPVFYELVDLGREERVEDTTQFGVWSRGMFFRLGTPGPDWE
jgi:hypothetical protein